MEFKVWLKNEIEKRNISPKELSIILGVTESAVSRYLSGQYRPSLRVLLKISKEWELPEKEVLFIGGYDENYKRLPKTGSVSEEIIPITPEKSDDDTYMDEHLIHSSGNSNSWPLTRIKTLSFLLKPRKL
jgi:transcriptional regulator with XRE-family HTH domain